MSDCENCKEYDTGKRYCPKFCDVIEHTLEEGYRQGRADAIAECITTIKEMHNMYDVMCGDWSNCYQIITELEQIKE